MLTFAIDDFGAPLRPVHFTGEEGISRLFQFQITCFSEDRSLDPAAAVGKGGQLSIATGVEPRFVHGVVSRFEVADAGVAFTEYRVTLVSWAHRFRQRRDSRIFQGLTTPQILEQVLASGGPLQLKLEGAYRPREYCVQYGESDWDFASRLMEEDGIHYFFEHDVGAHVLVLSDRATLHAFIRGGALPFRPGGGVLLTEDRVTRFRYAEETRPDKVTLRDFNFERPSMELEASAGGGATEVYEHPGAYELRSEGIGLASIRLEEAQAMRRNGEGESSCAGLLPGRQLELMEHPSDALNGGYLITRVEHEGGVPPSEITYKNRFQVIPAAVPFRPSRVTPRPTIRVQTAIVVGPPGAEIHTDAHGRVKVRFHWDRSGANDDRCSCWIRVSQTSAGPAFGALFLPRVGHEVVVDFLDGDPDRPIVTGSVYHGTNVPPYPLPAEKTKSTLKTRSSPGGDGSNELRFEDRKGSEEVYLHAERDLKITVEHDKHQHVGQDEDLMVTRARTVTVLGAHTETIGLAQTITVGGALTETVGGFLTETVGGFLTVTVGLAKTELVGGSSREVVGGMKSSKAGLDYSMTAGGNMASQAVMNVSVSAGGSASIDAGADMRLTAGTSIQMDATTALKVTAGKGMSVTVMGEHQETATTNRTVIADENVSIRCGGSTITMTKGGKILIEGKDITVTSSDPVKIEGKSIHVKSTAGDVSVEAKGNVTVHASNVNLN